MTPAERQRKRRSLLKRYREEKPTEGQILAEVKLRACERALREAREEIATLRAQGCEA
jgi:hypothetical protein